MAVLQGVTELFPISSLGHAVILPRLLDWPIDLKARRFPALPGRDAPGDGDRRCSSIFLRDWLDFLCRSWGFAARARRSDRRVFWLVVLATIPAVLVGSALPQAARRGVRRALARRFFLIVNGFLLFFGDLIAGETAGGLDQLNWKGALAVGFAQCFALIPGFSRSGSTIVAGVIAGLKHEESARFSFLMATPIILAATSSRRRNCCSGRDARRRGDPFRRRRRRRRLPEPRVPHALLPQERVRAVEPVRLLLLGRGRPVPGNHRVHLIR